MAELTISADDIQGAIEEYVSSFTSDTTKEEVGTVVDAGDGIAHVEGLPSVMTQELVADRDRENLAGALDLLTLFELLEVTQDDRADAVLVEVQRDAENTVGELEELLGHH